MKGKGCILVYVLVFTFLFPWHQEEESIPEEKDECPITFSQYVFYSRHLCEYYQGLKYYLCLGQAACMDIGTPLACPPRLLHFCSMSHLCMYTTGTEPISVSKQVRPRPNKLRIKNQIESKYSQKTVKS